MTKLVVAYDEHGRIVAAAGTGPRGQTVPPSAQGSPSLSWMCPMSLPMLTWRHLFIGCR